MKKTEKRVPDEDLKDAFYHNPKSEFKLEDIDNIFAEVAGANEGYDWYWIVTLKDGRFALIDAWCDCSGWACQSGVSISFGCSIDKVLDAAPIKEKYSNRNIRVQLKRQLLGVQPFGLYDESVKGA